MELLCDGCFTFGLLVDVEFGSKLYTARFGARRVQVLPLKHLVLQKLDVFRLVARVVDVVVVGVSQRQQFDLSDIVCAVGGVHPQELAVSVEPLEELLLGVFVDAGHVVADFGGLAELEQHRAEHVQHVQTVATVLQIALGTELHLKLTDFCQRAVLEDHLLRHQLENVQFAEQILALENDVHHPVETLHAAQDFQAFSKVEAETPQRSVQLV
mmetsp:Transcript_96573/g.208413  ORF Transcript_96573/g.208413 Transcript_96573/m.208413 type:complete len:213 (-) Transcript_96573:2191-2829(-)